MSASVTASEPGLMGDPGAAGRFGRYGGRYVPESLIPACPALEQEFRPHGPIPGSARNSPGCSRRTPAAPPR